MNFQIVLEMIDVTCIFFYYYEPIIWTFEQYFLSYCETKVCRTLVDVYNLIIKIYRGNLIHSSHHRSYRRSFPR